MAEICAGLNVLEMGAGSIASSMAGMVLADAGARVIKVEPPEGDGLREQHPSGFLVWNRGKESLVADLRTPPASSSSATSPPAADVVIEAFAPGTTDGWGIGADASVRRQPGAGALLDHGVRADRPVRQRQELRPAGRGQGRTVRPWRVRSPRRTDPLPGPVGQLRRGDAGRRRHPRRARSCASRPGAASS